MIIVLEKFEPPIITATSTPLLHLDANNDNSYNGSGVTWKDLSGNNFDATINGATFTSVGDLNFFDFDGLNDNIYVRNVIGGKQQLTVEYWVKMDEFKIVNPIFNNYESYGLRHSPILSYGFSSIGSFSGGFKDDVPGARRLNFTSTDKVVVNQWTHVVIVFDGSRTEPTDRFELYVNGIKKNIEYSLVFDFSTVPNNGVDFRIGRSADSAGKMHYSSFHMGMFRIFNDVLQEEEITRIYNVTKTLYN